MIVRLFTLKNGLEKITDVVAIRIKSKDYNLLILKDYVSILGEIHGTLEIEKENDTIVYDSIHASFMNDNNVFSVIFDEGYHD